MRQFIKFFFASFLALLLFALLAVVVIFSWIAVATNRVVEKPAIGIRAVLYIDLSETINEQGRDNPLTGLVSDQYNTPGLYDMVRLIRNAKTDSSIKGIYLKCGDNPNGFATSDELRSALLDFKNSRKFVYAYADVISQKAYYIANVATRIYCNPKGGLEWKGLSLQYMFFKQALDKLEIEPQIFYAGKFKSATEPLRTTSMTDANRLQSTVFLNDLYNRFLMETATARNVDTADLHRYANTLAIQGAADAVKYKLIDGIKYDDEVKDELKQLLGVKGNDKINFITAAQYATSVGSKNGSGNDKLALIYAQGDIVDGKGENGQIGGDTYRTLIHTAATDNSIKAIVVRVNSGGGSSMASENMWRELVLAKKAKPVILSFGDYAASGGYYMSCGADSIFTGANTLTGSIGVFSIIPNLQKFFSNKLGITFDGVQTGTYAEMPTASRPLNEVEKRFLQNDIDSIYTTFLQRVSAGRKINVALVDSIAQGRVWTGSKGILLGLADKTGTLQDALDCAARMAHVKSYQLKEYPEPISWWENIVGGYKKNMQVAAVKEELGEQGFQVYNMIKKVRQSAGTAQARMPLELVIR